VTFTGGIWVTRGAGAGAAQTGFDANGIIVKLTGTVDLTTQLAAATSGSLTI
jgi:hypothetical protein